MPHDGMRTTLRSCSGKEVVQHGLRQVPIRLQSVDGTFLDLTLQFSVADVEAVIISVHELTDKGFEVKLGKRMA